MPPDNGFEVFLFFSSFSFEEIEMGDHMLLPRGGRGVTSGEFRDVEWKLLKPHICPRWICISGTH